MIIPSNRLILVTGIFLSLSGLVFAVAPTLGYMLLALVLLYGLVVALDGGNAPGRLQEMSASVPNVCRLTRGREGELSVSLHRTGALPPSQGRFSLQVPQSFTAPQDSLAFQWHAGESSLQLKWPWTSEDRGAFPIEHLYLETLSSFGFWHARKTIPVSLMVKVYPDVLGERRYAPALFLNRGGVGIHPLRQVGRGRDFEKLREYQPGDGYEDIHWKATARRGHPVTKQYQVERTQEVYVVIDSSRLSGRPVAGRDETVPQLEHFLSSGLALGMAAERQGDHFGLITFSDKIDTFIRAKTGKAHFTACREALCSVQTRMVNPDFAEVCAFLRVRLRKRALLVWLSNLDDPMLAESFLQQIALVRRHHLVLVNMVKGANLQPLFSGTPPAANDELHQRLAGHLEWRDLRQLQQQLRQQGVVLRLIEQAGLTPALVQQYLEVKQRQLL